MFKYCFIFGVFLMVCGCSKPLPPEYLGFRDLQFGKLSMQESQIITRLAFYNPNSFSMELKKAEINVFLNDKLANHYVMDSTIEIPKKDSFFVPLDIRLNPQQLLGNALQILMNGNQVKIRLEGSAHVKRSGIGFNVPIHYEQMQKIDF
jgi:LEA14-like dessication related protein